MVYAGDVCWLIDSGSGHHLISVEKLLKLDADARRKLRPPEVPAQLQTANGVIYVDREVLLEFANPH